MLLQANKSVVLAAADTFRAAAIDQLQLHADKLGVKLIKHDYGADAAAVAFDAVKHGEAKGVDFVLIDTAGRMHSNVNLQDELKKIVVLAPVQNACRPNSKGQSTVATSVWSTMSSTVCVNGVTATSVSTHATVG